FIALAVIVAIVFVQEGQRRIPVQYAKRVVGRRMTAGGSTYLPLRVNMAGGSPGIFAASILGLPPTHRPPVQTPAAAEFPGVLQPEQLALRGRRGLLHRDLHLLLHGGHLQPGGPGGQPEEIRRVHPRGPSRATYRRIPGPNPLQAHLPRRPLPGRGRGVADDPDQPDVGQLLLWWDLDPDRRRRGPRYRQAARGSADDAQLRGLPEVMRAA